MRIIRFKRNHHQISLPSSSNLSIHNNDNEESMVMEAETLLEDSDNFQYYSTNDKQFYSCFIRLTSLHLIVQIHKDHNQSSNRSSIKSTSDLLIPLDYITNAYSLGEIITDRSRLYDIKLAEATTPMINTTETTNTATNHDNHDDQCESINDTESAVQEKFWAPIGANEEGMQTIDTSNGDSPTSATAAGAKSSGNNRSKYSHQGGVLNSRVTEYLYISVYMPFHRGLDKGSNGTLIKGNNVIILAIKAPDVTRNLLKSGEEEDINNHQIDAHQGQTSTIGAGQWIDAIKPAVHNSIKLDKLGHVQNISKLISPEVEKKILIMINPFGGQGKAMQIFRKKVLPMLVDSSVGFELFITKRANDAKDFLMNLSTNPNKWRSIVVLSGDGLFHEIINGLMFRSDWQETIGVPLGIIPAGSGNGLAHSLINRDYPDIANKDFVALSTMNVIRGRTSQADLVKVSTNSETYWSFLSVGWGLMADIDIESERFRILGELRFTLWSILRAFFLKTYRGKLSYQLIRKEKSSDNGGESVPNKTNLDNDVISGGSKEAAANDYIEIEENFVCVYAAYQTHLSSDVKMVPNAKLSDGTIALLYLTGELSSSQIINFLISIKTGAHVDLPYVTAVEVESFKLEPLDRSRITVDGEMIPWQEGPINVEVVPSLAKFLCKYTSDA